MKKALDNNGNYIVSFNNISSITASSSSKDTKASSTNTKTLSEKLVHYSGYLGEFYYDPEMFSVSRERDSVEYLSYIGRPSKGDIIRIPYGIKSCYFMFAHCKALEEAPIIPDSVTDCECMFYECISLKTAPIIPNGVINCDYMFFRCTSLEKPPIIPDSVTTCLGMFRGCESLKEAPIIPNSVKLC